MLELSRSVNAELFSAVIGGYGAFGVISEVELELVDNHRIQRDVERVATEDYPAFFREQIHANADAVLHNADLVPPDFDAPIAVTWRRTESPVTLPERLIPEDREYSREQNLIWSATEMPGGEVVRDKLMTEKMLAERPVVWRNREASLDADSLEPRTRRMSTYLLQEYFIPIAGFSSFLRDMRRILRQSDVNALNISIRHASPDRTSLMSWSRQEVFCFVLYYKQRSWSSADEAAGRWTRRLIDSALAHGGTYYLPYRLHADLSQFRRAYPRHEEFAALKESVDRGGRFQNLLLSKYLG